MGKKIQGKFKLDAHALLMPYERRIDTEVYIHLEVLLQRGSVENIWRPFK